MKRPNWQIVWSYLTACEGALIELYPEGELGVQFCVIDGVLCSKAQRIEIGKPWRAAEEVYLPFDISLNDFIKVCNKLPEEMILKCVFAAGLRKNKKNFNDEGGFDWDYLDSLEQG